MPTIFTHPLVALLKTWCPRLPMRVALAGAALTIVPDLDVIAFGLRIPYAHPLGHRGFTHSIVFALAISWLVLRMLRTQSHAPATFVFLFLCTISHGLLDALTDGGLGVGFLIPFHNDRYFFSWTPIRVSPIGAGFFSAHGWATLRSELWLVWLPSLVAGALGWVTSRIRRSRRA